MKMGNHLKPQISQIAQICDTHQFQRLIVFLVAVQPPPLTPPTRGGEKCFLPLNGGGLVGVLNYYAFYL